MNKEELKTMRVTFTDGTIYSCHMSAHNIIKYEYGTFLWIEEWFADGHSREVNIALDKVQMFSVE